MKKTQFILSVEADQGTGDIKAVYFKIRNGKVAKTVEYANGNAFADYGNDGGLLGVELLGPCKIRVLNQITREEPKPVKNFLRKAIPREMAIA